MTEPLLVAFFLPQFHPIPENDAFWGTGFTEWRNVVTAPRLFPGHHQPHLPADLGFYDLRVPEVQYAQADMATAHGVDALCYYHYWFNGRQLLDRPLRQLLERPDLEQPFCVCWANENWTRSWDGATSEVLIEQRYSDDDDRAHIQALLPVLADPRYLRVDGRPVLLVYRVENLPAPSRTADIWRTEATRAGLPEPWLLGVQSLAAYDPVESGLDAVVRFAPNWLSILGARDALRTDLVRGRTAIERRLTPSRARRSTHVTVLDYERLADMLDVGRHDARTVPCVATGWDNSPRRPMGGSFVVHGSSPEAYGSWLRSALAEAAGPDKTLPLVFVNAWNEWAEGAHLEPCQRWGRAYLDATAQARTDLVEANGPGNAG